MSTLKLLKNDKGKIRLLQNKTFDIYYEMTTLKLTAKSIFQKFMRKFKVH